MDFPGEKLLIAMWTTLAAGGVGGLLSPWQMKRQAGAHRAIRQQEILMLAQAEKDAEDIRLGIKTLTAEGSLLPAAGGEESFNAANQRIEPKITAADALALGSRNAELDKARAEINVAKAILQAEQELHGDPQEPAASKVDNDWLFAWRQRAGAVSSEDLQRLWGSVLAGEVKAPGRYSLRTLDFIRNLSKSEAEWITKLAGYVISNTVFRSQRDYMESQGLDLRTLMELQNIGILAGVESAGLSAYFSTSEGEKKFAKLLQSHDKVILLEHPNPAKTFEYKMYAITSLGQTILSLGSFSPDMAYLRLIASEIANQGFTVTLATELGVGDELDYREDEVFRAVGPQTV